MAQSALARMLAHRRGSSAGAGVAGHENNGGSGSIGALLCRRNGGIIGMAAAGISSVMASSGAALA
jgi:hypothetical protein